MKKSFLLKTRSLDFQRTVARIRYSSGCKNQDECSKFPGNVVSRRITEKTPRKFCQSPVSPQGAAKNLPESRFVFGSGLGASRELGSSGVKGSRGEYGLHQKMNATPANADLRGADDVDGDGFS